MGTTRTLGLLVPDIGNGFFADLAKGVEQASIERGFNVLLCNTGWNSERELFYLETLKSRAIDGVIYAAGAAASASQVMTLLASVQMVAVDEDVGELARSTIVSDNRAGGRLAAEHLAGLGHRRAVVLGASPQFASSMLRVDGFASAWMQLTGQSPEVVAGSFEEQTGYSSVADLIPVIREGGVTAIFALNDPVALGALQALREATLPVPAACSVIGFDDIYSARHVTPSLTTIRQDAVGMGAQAAEVLLAALGHVDAGGGLRTGRHVLPVTLVARKTTAPAPGHGAIPWR